MNKAHEIGNVSFENDRMCVEIDSREYAFDLKDVSPRLLNASARQREQYEVSASSYGIHWALVDEDLSIDGLLGIPHHVPEQQGSTLPTVE